MMKTNAIPAIIMLLAGLVASVAGIGAHMDVTDFMKMLLAVLVIFYVIGWGAKIVIDKFFAETQEEETTDGEESGVEEDGQADEDTADAGEKEE